MCACNDADLDDRNNKVHTNSNSTQDDEDPNGFASKEELVDAYLTAFYFRVVSMEEARKFYPEALWKYLSRETPNCFDLFYEQCKNSATNSIESMKRRFGDDYTVTWEIVSVEDKTQYDYDYTEEERQECMDMFGVKPEDNYMYEITVSITGSGSKGEYTNPGETVHARKIGNKWYAY